MFPSTSMFDCPCFPGTVLGYGVTDVRSLSPGIHVVVGGTKNKWELKENLVCLMTSADIEIKQEEDWG